MAINVGDRLPAVTLRQVTAEGPKEISSSDFFRGHAPGRDQLLFLNGRGSSGRLVQHIAPSMQLSPFYSSAASPARFVTSMLSALAPSGTYTATAQR